MKCPKCESTDCRKNGHRNGRQNYLCKNCGRQFTEPKVFNLLQKAEVQETPVASNGKMAHPTLTLPLTVVDNPFKTSASSPPGIAVLLLDIENLKLDLETEQFLATLSQHPLQVKIAFANWKTTSLAKQDLDLYDRGYQLIHVPEGKNGADAKMISFGASIFFHYPNIREVFVCSSDGILNHLCHELQNQGITVYWVRRQNRIINVENRNTGETNHYSLTIKAEIPSLEAFVQKIEMLLKSEQKSVSDRLSSLATLNTLFQERCQLSSVSISEPKNTTKVPEIAPTKTYEKPKTISSLALLEEALFYFIKKISLESKQQTVSVNQLKKDFLSEYKESADVVVKRFQPKSSLIKYFNTRSTIFRITLVDRDYQVSLVE